LLPAAWSDSSGSGGGHVPVVTYVPDSAPLLSPAAEPNGAGDSAEAVAAESEVATTPAEEAVTETGEAEAEEAVAEATSEPSWDVVAADEFTADISIDSFLPSSGERERASEPTSTAQQATGREVSDGRAERSAVSDTLDPVETATEQAWAAAARAVIDAAAGQRAGSDPAEPSDPRGQSAPARPADTRPILGAATAPRNGGAVVEEPRVRTEGPPESPAPVLPKPTTMAELGGIMAQGREAASERQGQEQRGAPSTPEVASVDVPFPAAQNPRSEGLPAAHIAALAVVGISLGGLAFGALLLLRRRRSSRTASRVSSRPSASAAAANPADARCDSMASPNGLAPDQPVRPLLRRSRMERHRERELPRGGRERRQRRRSVSERHP